MIPLDTGEPSRIPGDFRRNSQGNPLVRHPNGTRDLVYDRPSKWFDDYTGIDPIYANRGSWVHKLTERIDNGEAWRADLEFVAQGVALGIPVDTQESIARAWLRFLADHGLTVIHNEHNVVNDTLKVAGTLDRIVEWDGRRVVLDIKTGSKVDKTSYAVQLARYAGSVPYDVDTDERGTWLAPPCLDVAAVAHLALNAILKGEQGVYFEFVKVDLASDGDGGDGAHVCAHTLHKLKNFDLSSAFTTIAPPPSISGLEAPAGGDAQRTANAASPPELTLDELHEESRAINAERDGANVTLDEWRDMANKMSPHSRARIRGAYCNPIYGQRDATADPAHFAAVVRGVSLTEDWSQEDQERIDACLTLIKRVEDVMDAVLWIDGLKDVTTQPPEAAVRPPKPTTLPVVVDEGQTLSERDVEAAGRRYSALPEVPRAWVTVTGAQVRLSPAHGGRPTARRFEILRGLCALAEAGYDSDDLLRAVVHHILGDLVWQGSSAADVVAALDHDEAVRFARMCDTLAGAGDVSLRYTTDGRAVLEPSDVGVAA